MGKVIKLSIIFILFLVLVACGGNGIEGRYNHTGVDSNNMGSASNNSQGENKQNSVAQKDNVHSTVNKPYKEIGGGIGSNNPSEPADNTENQSKLDLSLWRATVSSVLHDDGSINYKPQNVLDSELKTSWVEGVDGSGIGEWIQLETDNEQGVSGFNIINGYASSKEFYYKNNRVKKIRIELSDGTLIEKSLEDNVIELQTVDFGRKVLCNSIKITILDTYNGEKYDDTCIAEIKLF